MARWTDCMKLSDYREYRSYLDGFSGCYQIGHYYGDFVPKYVGRAKNVWTRVSSYMDEDKCHNGFILEKLYAPRHNLWFRVIRTERYHGLEARQQAIFGIGSEGLYAWNKRIEWECLNM